MPSLLRSRSPARDVFAEKISGSRAARPELERLIDQLRPGDVVVRQVRPSQPLAPGSARDRPLVSLQVPASN